MERHGRRAEWHTVPVDVRHAVDAIAGSPVISAVNVSGGFSPGPAGRCDLADGRAVFVKACGSDLNPFTPYLHRREAAVMAALPPDLPVPRLIGAHDDGDWVALVFELVDGRMPNAPLGDGDADAILRVVEVLAEAGPPVVDGVLMPAGHAETVSGRPHRWRLVDWDDSRLDEWTRRHADDLIELETPWISAVAGDNVLHGDLRSDNVLISTTPTTATATTTTSTTTWVVDWPSAALGAPWVDLVALLPAMHHDGAPPPADVFARHPVGRRADPGAVDAYLCAILGYFTHESLLPPPPGLPTLRRFQATQAEISRDWLALRTGWR